MKIKEFVGSNKNRNETKAQLSIVSEPIIRPEYRFFDGIRLFIRISRHIADAIINSGMICVNSIFIIYPLTILLRIKIVAFIVSVRSFGQTPSNNINKAIKLSGMASINFMSS